MMGENNAPPPFLRGWQVKKGTKERHCLPDSFFLNQGIIDI